jgi:hypothetical protein
MILPDSNNVNISLVRVPADILAGLEDNDFETVELTIGPTLS